MLQARFLFFLLTIVASTGLQAQSKILHHDPEMLKAIRQGLTHVYNFEFDEAQPYFLEIKKKYPHHPAYPFSQALVLFTKNFPMKPGHPEYKYFSGYVNDCLKKAELILDKDPNNPDGIFCALSAHSYQALMFSFSKDYLQAISSAKKVYGYIKQGSTLKKEYSDFYYSSGLFHYYAEQYPETHPMVKPLMLFFENGDKEKGLNEMNISMLRSVYTRQESLILLAYVYMKYEDKADKSLEYSEKLYYNYPNNPFALAKYIEGLIFTHNLAKAREMMPKLHATHSEFFKMVAEVFWGMLDEKQLKRNDLAKQHYLRALQMCALLHHKTDDLQSFCYVGLGRICHVEKEYKKAILYYRKAQDIAEYEMVKKECNAYLQGGNRSISKH